VVTDNGIIYNGLIEINQRRHVLGFGESLILCHLLGVQNVKTCLDWGFSRRNHTIPEGYVLGH
jgi:hypothetical protein